ncbi:Putative type III effector; nopAH-like [Bradyrhizobium vignae]|uniref:Type III effector nopAH-like n=1 Tax=Bradyrhizobium vignae TaxID=1549949 RepID=A0A2U3QAQ4_9BRAD|nr:Putative type III effector; nopAH-like [Bradyrhizobium vignae]
MFQRTSNLSDTQCASEANEMRTSATNDRYYAHRQRFAGYTLLPELGAIEFLL